MGKQSLTLSIQEAGFRTEKTVLKGIFECKQPLAERASECTGIGYRFYKDQTICSVCLTYSKKSLSFSTG